jgi:ABC-type polysaccharide/polyol phosphate transport system ATPase subunit
VSALAVEFSHVYKTYPIYAAPGDRLKELATFNRRQFHTDYWALRDVSCEVRRGETFCIVGENGCGKSTLLQICAGILQPTSGTVNVNGRVAALLELGAGFNPEFSGRDNVYLNGAILGFSAAEMDRRFPDITEFAEIGDFIHQPVKTYSSGMIVRLAFAVAIHVEPEVLLVDEALAVGDIYFRQRCMRKVHELRNRGVTILFVSHSTSEVKALGDRAMWLDHGNVADIGPVDRVVTKYLAAMAEKDMVYQAADAAHHARPSIAQTAPEVIEEIPNVDHRFGDGRAELLGIRVADPAGTRLNTLEPDSSIVVRISVRAKANLDQPIIGFMFRNQHGMDFAGLNTHSEGAVLPPMVAGTTVTVDFHIDLPSIFSSSFSFSPAIANGTLENYAICDWIDNAVVLPMARPNYPVYGPLRLPCRVEVNARAGASPAPKATVGEPTP